MSTKEGIARMLDARKLLDNQIASSIIEDPHCFDGDSRKMEAYRITIHHFVEKQSLSNVAEQNKIGQYISIDLSALIDRYNKEDGDKKKEIAREMGLYVLHVSDSLLDLIPNETKNVVFKIIIEYLEEMSVS